jgi:transposase
VLWELWGVLSVLVERHEHFDGALVMRRSGFDSHRRLPRCTSSEAVIPEPSDQAGHRTRRGSRGGRPVAYDTVEYKRRAGIERGINVLKQWRGIATR